MLTMEIVLYHNGKAHEYIFSKNPFLTEMVSVVLKSICVIVQAKAEDVDLHNPAYVSDNLIDFTDSTPVVSFCQPHLENSWCHMQFSQTAAGTTNQTPDKAQMWV